MSEVNIPLLRKAVEWAEAEAAKPAVDRQWCQADWRSSPRRLASLIAVDADIKGLPDELRRQAIDALEPYCGTAYCIAGWVGQEVEPRYANTTVVDGTHVSAFAWDALCLREQQADMLFDANNTIEDVRRIAEEIAGERL